MSSIAAVLAVGLAAFLAPFATPVTRASSSLQFDADFDVASDFYDQFDYGYSGLNPWLYASSNAILSWPSDHASDCIGTPYDQRTVSFGGDTQRLDFDELFYHCTPNGDPAKGHVMTTVVTHSYDIAWFSPRQYFTGVQKVCWDINLTEMSNRRWTQVLFVDQVDAVRYPTSDPEGPWPNGFRGHGGYDLGYVNPEFRFPNGSGPSTNVISHNGTLAGFKSVNGNANWFQNDTQWTRQEFGDDPALYPARGNYDKASRYTHCLENIDANRMRLTQEVPSGGVEVTEWNGQIPQHPVRVVFQDDQYDSPKGAYFSPERATWHWDNIQVEAAEAVDAPDRDASPRAAGEAPASTIDGRPVGGGVQEQAAPSAGGGSGESASLERRVIAALGVLVLLMVLVIVGLLRSGRAAGAGVTGDPSEEA